MLLPSSATCIASPPALARMAAAEHYLCGGPAPVARTSRCAGHCFPAGPPSRSRRRALRPTCSPFRLHCFPALLPSCPSPFPPARPLTRIPIAPHCRAWPPAPLGCPPPFPPTPPTYPHPDCSPLQGVASLCLSWVFSPVLGALLAAFLFFWLRLLVLRHENAYQVRAARSELLPRRSGQCCAGGVVIGSRAAECVQRLPCAPHLRLPPLPVCSSQSSLRPCHLPPPLSAPSTCCPCLCSSPSS